MKLSWRRPSLATGAVGARLSVRQRLLGIAAVAALAFAVVGGISALTAARVGRTAAHEHRMVALQEQYLRSDIVVSKLRGQVFEVAAAAPGAEREEALEKFAGFEAELEALMVDTLRDVPGGALLQTARSVHEQEESFLAIAQSVTASVSTADQQALARSLRGLDDQVDSLEEQITALTEQLSVLQEEAVVATAAARISAAQTVAVASVLGVLVVTTAVLVTIRSILSGLHGVSSAADRLTAGDFGARVAGGRRDEIGALGGAFNATADSLQGMMGRLQKQRERDTFGRELNEALEMADTEDGTFEAIGRSLAAVSATHPAELLIADSSRAHLELRAAHPEAGAPGCPVASPFACVAVRRGTTTSFPDSRALNACPLLRDRDETPCAAVCVPVTFMGRALGVLHTTTPIDAPAEREEVARLATLAASAGARIGTVRSFELTQLQAATDGLTGLMNRRAFETTARAMLRDGRPASVVMADLDHFKLINDTHGHETGDRALRLFTEQLRGHLRSDDLFARYGGEEFVLLLPGLAAEEAAGVLDRFRERLAATTSLHPPVFTASFGVTDNEVPDSLAGMIRRADAALYRAKALGRNCVVVDELGPDTVLTDAAVSTSTTAPRTTRWPTWRPGGEAPPRRWRGQRPVRQLLASTS